MYWTVKVGSQSLESAMAAWWLQGDAPQSIISDCVGWSCNSACNSEKQPALQGGAANGQGAGATAVPHPPAAPAAPGSFVYNPSINEPWQEQLAQYRKGEVVGVPSAAPTGDWAGDHGQDSPSVPGAAGQMGTR